MRERVCQKDCTNLRITAWYDATLCDTRSSEALHRLGSFNSSLKAQLFTYCKLTFFTASSLISFHFCLLQQSAITSSSNSQWANRDENDKRTGSGFVHYMEKQRELNRILCTSRAAVINHTVRKTYRQKGYKAVTTAKRHFVAVVVKVPLPAGSNARKSADGETKPD